LNLNLNIAVGSIRFGARSLIGDSLDIDPHRVGRRGCIYLDINGRVARFGGYLNFVGRPLPGRVVAEGASLRLYFWEDRTARDRGEPAIVPEGHLTAVRQNHGRQQPTWRINHLAALHSKPRGEYQEPYWQYLFQPRVDELHRDHWLIDPSRKRSAQKVINGRVFRLPFDRTLARTAIYSVTRELDRRLKLAEFWPSAADVKAGEPAFAARFVTVKPLRGPWKPFWVELDDMDKFKYLIRRGLVAKAQLVAVLTHPYLLRHYGPQNGLDRASTLKRINILAVAEEVQGISSPGLSSLTKTALSAEVKRASQPLCSALTQGLGKTILRRFWKVNPNKSGGAFVEYFYQGKRILIFGFDGYHTAFSEIKEKGGEIRARFYANPLDAAKDVGCILEAVLSRKIRCGRNQRQWVPLKRPKIIFLAESVARNDQVRKRLKANQMFVFLQKEQTEGFSFDLSPRLVLKNGMISYSGRVEGRERRLNACGYPRKYVGQRLPGRIVTEGDVKRAYFWESEEARANGALPIIPEGHSFVRRETNKKRKWEILWANRPEVARARQTSERYARFLRAKTNGQVHVLLWPVVRRNDGKNYPYRGIERRIMGVHLSAHLPPRIETRQAYSETIEVADRFKIISFWADEDSRKRAEPAFMRRFITFTPSQGPRRIFWAGFRGASKFNALIRAGEITQDELLHILSSDEMSREFRGDAESLMGTFSH
jgi:hypothetical protein